MKHALACSICLAFVGACMASFDTVDEECPQLPALAKDCVADVDCAGLSSVCGSATCEDRGCTIHPEHDGAPCCHSEHGGVCKAGLCKEP